MYKNNKKKVRQKGNGAVGDRKKNKSKTTWTRELKDDDEERGGNLKKKKKEYERESRAEQCGAMLELHWATFKLENRESNRCSGRCIVEGIRVRDTPKKKISPAACMHLFVCVSVTAGSSSAQDAAHSEGPLDMVGWPT